MFKAYGKHLSFTPPQDIDAFLGTALVLDLLLSLGTGIGAFAPTPLVFPWQHCCSVDSVPLNYKVSQRHVASGMEGY